MVACGFNTNCGDIILVYLMTIRSQIQTPRRHHKKLWNIRVKRKVFSRAFYTGRFGVFFWLNLVVVVALIMQLVPHFYPRFFGLSNKEAVHVILAFFYAILMVYLVIERRFLWASLAALTAILYLAVS